MATRTSSSELRRNRQRPVSAAAREAILKAAEAEFAERGFGGARAQSIATRAGVNKALPFYHFGSKADLYAEVVKQALGRLGEFMADALIAPPHERIAVFVHRLFAYLSVNPNWPRLIVRELIDGESRARDTAGLYLKPLVDAGREVIAYDIEAGRMREVDPLQMIISITVETFGYFLLIPLLQGVGMAEPISPDNLAARERMVVELLKVGLGVRGPEPPAGQSGSAG
jgi:TetR/AcrR family transcriptional regulator